MQGKKLLVTAISSLAACALTSSAYAIMSVPCGWYLEANIGSTKVTDVHYNGTGKVSPSGIGGNANLGYKFMPFLGLELGYTQYANTSIKTPAGTQAGTVKLYSYDLALRGILPIVDSGFEAFAKAGAGRINAHVNVSNQNAANSIGLGRASHSNTNWYYGVGGQYYWMPELAIVVQWQTQQGNSATGTGSLLTGGLSFIFD